MGAMRAGTFATRTVVHGASLVRASRRASGGAGLPDRLRGRDGRLLGPEDGRGLGGRTRRRDRLRRGRALGDPGRAGCRCGGDPRARPGRAEARGRAPLRGDAHGRGRAARLRLRRRRAARDGGAGAAHARPRRARWSTSGSRSPGPRRSCRSTARSTGGMRILVSHGGDHVPAEDFPLLLSLAAEGRLDLAGMVTKRIELDDVEAGVRRTWRPAKSSARWSSCEASAPRRRADRHRDRGGRRRHVHDEARGRRAALESDGNDPRRHPLRPRRRRDGHGVLLDARRGRVVHDARAEDELPAPVLDGDAARARRRSSRAGRRSG